MGLDMYLVGDAFNITYGGHKRPKRDGFDVQATRLEVGYWRKHRMLHGYIVENFADGEDDCRPIDLRPRDLEQIENALREWVDNPAALPETSGFFFGDEEGDEHYRKQAQEDADKFRDARCWLEEERDGIWKSIEYEASW